MKAIVSDPFAPLAEPPEETGVQEDLIEPIWPVPPDVPRPSFWHGALGEPSTAWEYRDEAGRLLCCVARFETGTGKEFLPRTWCRRADGSSRWYWKALPVPRPLYGLDRLAAESGAPVLLVEGEKTADAANKLFSGYVAVTWPGGAKAFGKADFQPLAHRDVVLWPDADAGGKAAMRAVAERLLGIGARSAAVVQLPDDLPEKWDLADPVPEGVDINELLSGAKPFVPEPPWPAGYIGKSTGLHWQPDDPVKLAIHLTGPMKVRAETRDLDGNSWGVLLEWLDHDGRLHRQAIPRSTLAGDGADARRMLLDGGLYVTSNRLGREKLTAFLASVQSGQRVRATNHIGWHGSAFVFPGKITQGTDGEEVLLQGLGVTEHAFRENGTLEEWQNEIARYAAGNSRLTLAISAAFAAPLLHICGGEGGGIHFRGASSTGKTTALTVAGSVWGGGAPGGYIRSWRATANGLEGVGLGHCDTLLCLDELAQISPREAGEAAYMLANGSGKSRSTRDGSARRAARWRVLFLSSGELSLSDKVAEDGRRRRATAGQQVRVLEVAADAGGGLGLFENLHGFETPDAFARHLRNAAARYYGTAARAFINEIASDHDGVRSAVQSFTTQFVEDHVPPGSDGQVTRAAQRFALVGAGGELAIAAGILPWASGEAINAAARCYVDWLSDRGGTGAIEIRDGIEQVRSFLNAHGMARFAPAWEHDQSLPIRDLAGYRKNTEDGWDFFVTGTAWREELCAGFNASTLARELSDRGWLIKSQTGTHMAPTVRVPGAGKLRLYRLSSKILEANDD